MSFEKYLKLKRLVDCYYDVQDVRIRSANRLRIFPTEAKAVYPDRLKEVESDLKLEIQQLLYEEPIWDDFLSKWRGVGPCIAGSLIAIIMLKFTVREPLNELETSWSMKTKDGKLLVPELRGIGKFDNPSKLHAFFGLDVHEGHAPWRKRGDRESVTWSPKARMLSWKIGEQFVKQGRYYRQVYLVARQVYEARPDLQQGVWINPRTGKIGKGAKGHRYQMAKRKMVKQFLTDLWVAWRKLEGLSTVNPYVIDKLKHVHYQVPPALGDRAATETIEPSKECDTEEECDPTD